MQRVCEKHLNNEEPMHGESKAALLRETCWSVLAPGIASLQVDSGWPSDTGPYRTAKVIAVQAESQ